MDKYTRRMLITSMIPTTLRSPLTLPDFRALSELIVSLTHDRGVEIANELRIDLDQVYINHDVRLDRHVDERGEALHRKLFDEIAETALPELVDFIDKSLAAFKPYLLENEAPEGYEVALVLAVMTTPSGSVFASSDIVIRKV